MEIERCNFTIVNTIRAMIKNHCYHPQKQILYSDHHENITNNPLYSNRINLYPHIRTIMMISDGEGENRVNWVIEYL